MNTIAIIGPGGATNNSLYRKAKKLATSSVVVTKKYFKEAWRLRNQRRNYSAVNASGNLAAFALVDVHNSVMHISLIASRPGAGIGKQMMLRIIQDAKRRRVKKIDLDSVSPAVGFYEKLGFKKYDVQDIPPLTSMYMILPAGLRHMGLAPPVKKKASVVKKPPVNNSIARLLRASKNASASLSTPKNSLSRAAANFRASLGF